MNSQKIHSGFTTQLLTELVAHRSCTEGHINYLLSEVVVKLRCRGWICTADKISPSQLLKKGIIKMLVYQKLVDCGMTVMAEDIVYAVRVLQKLNKVDLMKLLVAQCKDYNKTAYSEAIDIATKNKNSKQFIAALKEGTRVHYACNCNNMTFCIHS